MRWGGRGETPFVGHTIQQKEYQELIRQVFQWNCTHIKNREGRSFTVMVYIETVAAAEAAVIAKNKLLSKSMRWLNPRGNGNGCCKRSRKSAWFFIYLKIILWWYTQIYIWIKLFSNCRTWNFKHFIVWPNSFSFNAVLGLLFKESISYLMIFVKIIF